MLSNDDAALIILPPQHLGRGKAGCAAADDHDLVRLACRFATGARLSLDLVADNDLVVVLLDLPAREGAERRRAHGFAGADVEAGMVPWAAHLPIRDHTQIGRASCR